MEEALDLSFDRLLMMMSKPLRVSTRLAAHQQEDQLCINSNWYSQDLIGSAICPQSESTFGMNLAKKKKSSYYFPKQQ